MLLMARRARVDPDMAAIACQVTRPTILQAVHRLREQGLVIQTYPEPPGPSRVTWYKLDAHSRPKAWELLAWWSEPDPDAWSRYTKLMPQEANIHDTTGQPIQKPAPIPTEPDSVIDFRPELTQRQIEEAHADALLENTFGDTHW